MTDYRQLSDRERDELEALGITPGEAQRQLDLLRHPPAPAVLLAPCRLGDGILRISEDRQASCVAAWQALVEDKIMAKFVPASGAATRMFRDLSPLDDEALSQLRQGLAPSPPSFAFRQELLARLAREGTDLCTPATPEALREAARLLLDDNGLGYRQLAKGLVPFHAYSSGSRTALVEHLWEGVHYLGQPGSPCRFHFTVTPDHEHAFRAQVDAARIDIAEELGTDLQVDFSHQSPSTDTLAIDLDGDPVRQDDGSLLLRPAGHGALIDNLQQVAADVAIIKNIDNISHQRFHEISIHWKRVLTGFFASLQNRVFEQLAALEDQLDSAETVSAALDLLQQNFAIKPAPELLDSDLSTRSHWVRQALDRPLRVCGVVENIGEPGGGPFWIRHANGQVSGQIIEGAQVDSAASDQMEIWRSSTHFNPVDLVCGLRNRHGQPYRLAAYVDPDTAFVTEKSLDGQPLMALERPGLWNGSMANWNTAFVEVPLATFTPVKTVFDLLRPEHQP